MWSCGTSWRRWMMGAGAELCQWWGLQGGQSSSPRLLLLLLLLLVVAATADWDEHLRLTISTRR